MAMDKSAADAFVYAKASGMLARSFTGSRAVALFKTNSLHELWNLVFKTEVPSIPEKLLAKEIESQAQNAFVCDYIKLLSNYEKPDPLLIDILELYEYSNLKEIAAALCFNEKEIPSCTDIKQYSHLHYDKWPSLKAITEGTEFSWYNKVPEVDQLKNNDFLLDLQHIKKIWKAVNKLHGEAGTEIKKIVRERYSLENIIWALRLKVYYKMSADEIIKNLSFVEKENSIQDPIGGEAVKILNWETDSYQPWSKWKYRKYLNPNEEGTVWNLVPKYFALSVKKINVKKAEHLFHQFPDTFTPLFCYFMLKENEVDMIRMASEALRLDANMDNALVRAGLEAKNG